MDKDNPLVHNLLDSLKFSKGNINKQRKKVSIIGCGDAGTCCAVALMNSNIVLEICLISYLAPEKAYAEMLDLQNFAPPNVILSYSSVIEDSYTSDICVISVDKSADQGIFVTVDDFDRLNEDKSAEILKRNIGEYERIMPKIAKLSPNAVFIIATYPSTTMSYVTWKLTKFPIHRIIGIGTAIDTIEFISTIARNLGISIANVCGYVVGIRTAKIILWSQVFVAGTKLIDIDSDLSLIRNPEGFYARAQKEFLNQKMVYARKGAPYFSIGVLCAQLVKAVLTDSKEIFTVTCRNKGCYGIENNVFISLPCVIGSNGVQSVITPPLTNYEIMKIQQAADKLHKLFTQLSLL